MYTKYVLSPEYKAKLFSDPKIVTLVVGWLEGTTRTDKGNVHENVAQK